MIGSSMRLEPNGARRRFLIVGTHPCSNQPSMKLFSNWLQNALEEDGETNSVHAPAFFLNRYTNFLPIRKWLGYLDQYVLLTIGLGILQFRYDAVISADHSNSVSLALVTRPKSFSMVHDTIAIRQAFGQIEDEPAASWTGRILQRLIVQGLGRCNSLLANPEPVGGELRALGVTSPIHEIGCPFDARRLTPSDAGLAGVPDEAVYLINVASDLPRKRKQQLLRLWRHVENVSDDLWLVLAGGTSAETKALATTLGLQRVLILGKVSDEDLANLYQRCRGAIISSRLEGFCIPILEAVAFDKPVYTPSDIMFFTTVFGRSVRPIVTFDQKGALAIVEAATAIKHQDETARADILRRFDMKNFSRRVRLALNLSLNSEASE